MSRNSKAAVLPAQAGRASASRGFKVKPIKNTFLLMVLTAFQLLTGLTVFFDDKGALQTQVALVFAVYIGVEWLYFLLFRTIGKRRNFELEFIAFFLCGVGLVTISSVMPDYALKQFVAIMMGLAVFVAMVWFMGDVERAMKLRMPLAILSVLLLVVNLAIAKVTHGARNWIDIGFISIQPSEFVKVAFVFVGAATLEKLQATRNLWAYLVFACACIGSLFIMKDFGTALIFFFTFCLLAFMRSGDVRTIMLTCAAGLLGAVMIIQFRPHVMSRFKTYRHVWELVNEGGMQQTRVLIGMVSGGLFGVGIGNGFVKKVFASTTDLIFGVICEEWGLIFGLILVLVFAGLAVSALKNSIASRSTFYSIAACSAAGLLLFQVCLNIFGITDVLPLTGVTLPFISRGGSSMICCWGLLAFIKASDVRTYNSGFLLGGARK